MVYDGAIFSCFKLKKDDESIEFEKLFKDNLDSLNTHWLWIKSLNESRKYSLMQYSIFVHAIIFLLIAGFYRVQFIYNSLKYLSEECFY